MFSIEKKFVFIHPQKTGGNTISKILLPYTNHVTWTNKSLILKGGFGIQTLNRINKHDSIDSHARIGVNSEWTIFGSIRHPVDRLISWWHYEKTIKTNQACESLVY